MKKYWGTHINDIGLYEQAFRHKSMVGSGKFRHKECNERLELLGDAVLDAVITERIYLRFPESNEGHLTKIRAKLVNREILSSAGRSAHLDEYIDARIGTVDSMDKIIGNALEALLGAIYLDKGFSAAKRSIDLYLLPRYVDFNHIIASAYDHKSKLLEWAQQNKKRVQFSTKNKGLDVGFESIVCLDEKEIGNGTEASKKKAEQAAAEMACLSLNLS